MGRWPEASKDVTAGRAAVLNACVVVSITTLLLRQKVPCPYGSLEKGRAIGVNVG